MPPKRGEGSRMGFFSTYENEDLMEAATDEQYRLAQVCPNCHENRDDWIELWPNHSFVLRKCLSCGQFFSIAKNLRRMGVKVLQL